MPLKFVLAALLGAALALALPAEINRRDDDINGTYSRYFRVTNLQAFAVTLSHRVEYHFNVSFRGTQEPVDCSLLGTQLGEQLFNVTAPCTAGTNTSFSWQQNEDGSAKLNIYRQLSTDVAEIGTRNIARNETIFEGPGEFAHQVYVGPQNFTTPTTLGYISSDDFAQLAV